MSNAQPNSNGRRNGGGSHYKGIGFILDKRRPTEIATPIEKTTIPIIPSSLPPTKTLASVSPKSAELDLIINRHHLVKRSEALATPSTTPTQVQQISTKPPTDKKTIEEINKLKTENEQLRQDLLATQSAVENLIRTLENHGNRLQILEQINSSAESESSLSNDCSIKKDVKSVENQELEILPAKESVVETVPRELEVSLLEKIIKETVDQELKTLLAKENMVEIGNRALKVRLVEENEVEIVGEELEAFSIKENAVKMVDEKLEIPLAKESLVEIVDEELKIPPIKEGAVEIVNQELQVPPVKESAVEIAHLEPEILSTKDIVKELADSELEMTPTEMPSEEEEEEEIDLLPFVREPSSIGTAPLSLCETLSSTKPNSYISLQTISQVAPELPTTHHHLINLGHGFVLTAPSEINELVDGQVEKPRPGSLAFLYTSDSQYEKCFCLKVQYLNNDLEFKDKGSLIIPYELLNPEPAVSNPATGPSTVVLDSSLQRNLNALTASINTSSSPEMSQQQQQQPSLLAQLFGRR